MTCSDLHIASAAPTILEGVDAATERCQVLLVSNVICLEKPADNLAKHEEEKDGGQHVEKIARGARSRGVVTFVSGKHKDAPLFHGKGARVCRRSQKARRLRSSVRARIKRNKRNQKSNPE